MRRNKVSVPDDADGLAALTPFAVEFRYDDLPEEPEVPFNREWALECVRRTRAWAESVLGGEDRT